MNFSTNRMPKLARAYMCTILVVVDFLSILFSFAVTTVLWNLIKHDIVYSQYLLLIPFLLLFNLAFAMLDLYPGIGQSPITEFRSLTIATTIVFLILAALSFVMLHMNVYSRAVFILSWVLCLLLIPTMRSIVVRALSKRNLWGDPVIIIGLNERTRDLVKMLLDHPDYGFIPTMILNFAGAENNNGPLEGVPVLNIPRNFKIRDLGRYAKIQTAIVITDDSDQALVNPFLKEGHFHFSRIVIIPERQLGSLWVTPFDIGGMLGFEIKQNLLSSTHRLFKRVVDLLLVAVASPFIFLGGLIIALAIKLDSRGPVFYRENRIGMNGDTFRVWKFRTMVENANLKLEEHLQANPDLAKEWSDTHKLKNDPRITRVGKFLRRFSLDEFPQLINVVKNEMSLVGPRPIVDDEICRYGDRFELYKRVKPGMSGLWQVSGRNDLTYDTRVDLDEYYVRNYSIWMDLYIIRQTLGALISNRGAY
jgi:Undecaprenyl-phosphate galactose phosphotransferase WbaP